MSVCYLSLGLCDAEAAVAVSPVLAVVSIVEAADASFRGAAVTACLVVQPCFVVSLCLVAATVVADSWCSPMPVDKTSADVQAA